MITIEHYVTADGLDVFDRWFDRLRDDQAIARIASRLKRLKNGVFGDCKSVGGGVWELRIDYGPGYRLYYSMIGRTAVLLLCGGDKRRQDTDIKQAIEYLNDYKRRFYL